MGLKAISKRQRLVEMSRVKLLKGICTNTSGGNLSLHDLNCGLKAGTSGGNIDVSVHNLVKGISINNSAGNVNLKIPKNKVSRFEIICRQNFN